LSCEQEISSLDVCLNNSLTAIHEQERMRWLVLLYTLTALPIITATSSIALSTTTTLPAATAVGNYHAIAVPVNNFYFRNQTNDPDGIATNPIFQSYLQSLYSSIWTLALSISLTTDGSSSTSAIYLSGPENEVPDLTPSVVAAKNDTTFWDVCFLYFPDFLTNYDTSHPNGAGAGTANFNGSCQNVWDMDCFEDIINHVDNKLFFNSTQVCAGKDGTGHIWTIQTPKNCSSVVGNTPTGNISGN
jgi:hypothetical protein